MAEDVGFLGEVFEGFSVLNAAQSKGELLENTRFDCAQVSISGSAQREEEALYRRESCAQ